ncbi:MAG: hypothetical protein ACYC9S_03790 [Leptospirales bacterium]
MEKVRQSLVVLIPVWGNDYVANLLDYGICSFLGQKNLNELRIKYDIHLVILTSETDARTLDSSLTINKIKEFFNYNVILIDDILHLDYGSIVTISYFRGMNNYYNYFPNVTFIYLVADYVLSDNVFDTICQKIEQGANVVFSISLRCVDDDFCMDSILDFYREKSDLIRLPSRDAIYRAFSILHPSFQAKIQGIGPVFSENIQHLYWRVNSSTLIARCFMLHMLAIKPTRWADHVPGYCDYSFVPAFAPDGPFMALNDSDDGVILEFQNVDHEHEFTTVGTQSFGQLANSLASWATNYNISLAHFPFILHCSELPDNLSSFQSQADRFIDEIVNNLKIPLTHDPFSHPHWISALKSHKNYGVNRPIEVSLSSLQNDEPYHEEKLGVLIRLVQRFFKKLDIDINAFRQEIENFSKGKKIAVICDNFKDWSDILPKSPEIHLFKTKFLLRQLNKDVNFSVLDLKSFDGLIIMLSGIESWRIDQLSLPFRNVISSDQDVLIVLGNPKNILDKNNFPIYWTLKHISLTINYMLNVTDWGPSVQSKIAYQHLRNLFRSLKAVKRGSFFAAVTAMISSLKFIYRIFCFFILKPKIKVSDPKDISSSKALLIRGRMSLPQLGKE